MRLRRAVFRRSESAEGEYHRAGVVAAMVRRWYVLVIGAVAFLALYASFAEAGMVYQSVSKITFVQAGDAPITASHTVQTPSLVAFATMIETQFNHGESPIRFAQPSATIFGAGVREGYRVQVPNSGGQWNYYFADPELSIQVVGPSSAWVEKTRRRLTARVDRLSAEDQQQLGIPQAKRIVGIPSGGVPQAVGGTKKTRLIGVVALIAAGVPLIVASAVGFDALVLRRERRLAGLPRQSAEALGEHIMSDGGKD